LGLLDKTAPGRQVAVRGLRGGSLGAVAAALANHQSDHGSDQTGYPLIFIVTAHHERSGEIADDLAFFGLSEVFHWPKSQVLPYEDDTVPLEEQVRHLEFLEWLVTRDPAQPSSHPAAVCVAPIEALFHRVPPIELLRQQMLRIGFGDSINPEEFAARAEALGYTRTPTVEARGEFAVRGGILDIFPLDAENPLRIDLFGDEVESIREFEAATQRSIKRDPDQPDIDQVVIFPASEQALAIQALEYLGPTDPLPTLLDLLPERTLLLLDTVEGYTLLDERFRQLIERQWTIHRDTDAAIAPPERLYATLADIEKAARRHVQLIHSLAEVSGRAQVPFDAQGFDTQKPSFEHYVGLIRSRLSDGWLVSIVADNDGQARRLEGLLSEQEIGVIRHDGRSFTAGGRPVSAPRKGIGAGGGWQADVLIVSGQLHSGFILPAAGLFIVTDREIFGRYKRRHVYRKLYKGQPIADPRQIRQGDFVVHLEHGVGKFEGVRTQNLDGRIADFLELTYADGAKLLVPVEKIHLVQKFSSADAVPSALDKLGSGKWTKRRQKSLEEIQKLAAELIALYAKRELSPGYSFQPDNGSQQEFEASFLHTETPDQLRAIAEVKKDMESNKPMDRLVCGDVGFGKTEVAIRAAFKAIQDGKQVALLCPTTILAQQHYFTFRERFADWPIRVEKVSRFESAKQIKEIAKGLAAGEVHMVIGTHAILSKSIQFKDLGLVIVDEEQRFGVAQKERLKEMRASVDFLTLTATPIPRTLYMALSGLRDMSVINTPPADRQPIRTKIIHWDRELLEEAILRELNRGGQVFFIHNRVQNIHQVAERVQEIVPSARLAIAHGQMNERDLEQVMLDFIDRKFDILVSTTIIESGVDIPNCNTIIINRADAFGLAQLYQMRGRVGREDRRAYAYLIVPQGQPMSEQAISRLKAIEEFTTLGMGFNIALRDLEIRGTGNLLGKEQSGTMNAIGFELYCQMLEEAVAALRNGGSLTEDSGRGVAEVEVQWKVNAYLPAQFVPVEAQRVALYKQIAEAKTVADIDDIASEIRDRYGEIRRDDLAALTSSMTTLGNPGHAGLANGAYPTPGNAALDTAARVAAAAAGNSPHVEDLPAPVENLLDAARIRILGTQLGLSKVVGLTEGFRLIKDNIVRDLGPAAAQAVAKVYPPRKTTGPAHAPKVFVDNPDILEFYYEDFKRRKPLAECAAILQAMVGDSPVR
jgi:transcription-repair coupling factor (superfamily II helicase)